jgi:hypothetical protein
MATTTGTVDRCPHQLRGRLECTAAVSLGDGMEAAPGRELRTPERLREPHVPDAGDDRLVEQRLAEPACLIGRSHPREHAIETGRLLEDVRPEPGDRPRVQFEDGAVPEHSLGPRSAQYEPGFAGTSTTEGRHRPATRQPQVRAEHDATVEAEDQVLADRLDRLEHAAVDPLCDPAGPSPRVRRLGGDPLADQHLEASGGTVDRVPFGHGRHGNDWQSGAVNRARSTAAGAAAALVWAAAERLDRQVFANDYTDVALVGKFITRSPAWPIAGTVLHAANGAAFGFAFDVVRRRVSIPPRRLALGLALTEHLALFPLGALVDRYHPARGEPGLERVFGRRAFAQATVRHAIFGLVLGRLAA